MEERPLNHRIVESGDGSHTLRVDNLKEHYHSHKGAIQESRHVFLKMGVASFPDDKPLRILEVGFGTGLNALLTLCDYPDRSIHYTTLEAFPLAEELVEQLNYPLQIEHPKAKQFYQQLHSLEWEKEHAISAHFSFLKHAVKLQEFHDSQHFDLIYYDAFAPHAQPELWTLEIWERLFGMLNKNGILVTYCAKGQVRRDMQTASFEVERLKGPPGKREMLRARKT